MLKCSLLAIAAATTPGDSDVMETQSRSSGGQAGSPAVPQTCLGAGLEPGGPPPEALAVFLPWPMMTIRATPRNKVKIIAMPKNVAATVVPVD